MESEVGISTKKIPWTRYFSILRVGKFRVAQSSQIGCMGDQIWRPFCEMCVCKAVEGMFLGGGGERVRGAEGEEKGEEKAERHLVYLFVIFFFWESQRYICGVNALDPRCGFDCYIRRRMTVGECKGPCPK